MRQLYEKVNVLLQLVPYEDICPGFRRCGYAIYNSSQVWLADKVIPWDNRFVGNTAIEFEGEFIAIYQVENPGKTDAEILAANLVHEMFHAYQMRSGEDHWPDDFKLLAYPENIENYRLKYAENQLLADAYGEIGSRRAGMLAAFRAIREQRRKLAGEYLKQELLIEHIEGRAEYAGCRALQFINPHKFQERMERYLCALRNMNQAFFDIRQQAYITGAVYNLACADCGEEEPLQTELRHYQHIRAERIKDFLEKKTIKKREECLICGYDPMNMILCGRQLLCTHFVVLKIGESMQFLDGPVLLKLKQSAGREVEEYRVLP